MEDFTLEFERASVDAIYYELHPPPGEDSAEALEALREQCLAIALPLTAGYIWQRDSLQLTSSELQQPPWRQGKRSGSARSGSSSGGLAAFREGRLPCLWGAVQFGDNLEDEWFVAWLLRELTARMPGLAARAWDNDGEFLLIEAAYALPRWLKPETSSNRVWFSGGQPHIVPLPSAAAPTIPSVPTATQALQLLRSDAVPTLAGRKVQAALEGRLGGYPARALAQMHRARVALPAAVAAVLRAEPNLVAPAVEGFYNRDVDDMRAAARLARFPPQDMVTVTVAFSRCLYAQLAQQAFEPPKGYPSLPPPDSKAYPAAYLGMKLACAMEMLHASRSRHVSGAAVPDQEAAGAGEERASNGAAASTSAPDGLQDLGGGASSGNPGWRAFLASLEANGYFKGNIAGSAEHTRLLRAAWGAYSGSAAAQDEAAAQAAPALRIDEILRQPALPGQVEQDMAGAADDDAWMRDGAGELERELAARQAQMDASRKAGSGAKLGDDVSSGEPGQGEAAEGAAFDAQRLADQFKAFVGATGSMEGAELPGEGNPAREDPNAAKLSGAVSFDSAAFLRSLGDALGLPPGSAYLGDDMLGSGESSGDEGSSFFGDGGSDSSDEDGGMPGEEPDPETVYRVQRAERSAVQQQAGSSAAAGLGAGSMGAKPASMQTPPAEQWNGSAANSRAGIAGAQRGSVQPGQGKNAAGAAATSAAPDVAAQEQPWETLTATDSDDDNDDGASSADSADFGTAYEQTLQRELAATRMGASFAKSGDATTDSAAAGASPAAAHADAKGKGRAAGGGWEGNGAHAERGDDSDQEELRPVDVDLNLVQNLLASYAGQQGLPGPASNLAGLMGISLPDDKDASKGPSGGFDSFLSQPHAPR